MTSQWYYSNDVVEHPNYAAMASEYHQFSVIDTPDGNIKLNEQFMVIPVTKLY